MRVKRAAFTVVLLLAVSLPLSAKNSSPRLLFLTTPVTMDGAEIPRGIYQLNVESSNSVVRIELRKDGRFIATARGVWVKSGMKFKENTILLRVNPDGSRSLIELRLAGAAKSIVLQPSADATVQYSAK